MERAMMLFSAERRNFLTSLAAVGAVGNAGIAPEAHGAPGSSPSAPSSAKSASLTISDARILQLTGKNGKRAFYLKLLTEQGVDGLYGPVDEDAARIVDSYFRKPLVGSDAFASESFWDRAFRSNRHSRGSYYLMGVSAVDNALWDLKGRFFGLPVYRLLGGSRDKVQAYASCLGLSEEADALQAKARELRDAGYRHQKWFVRSRGPKYGPGAVTKDVEVVRLLREAVGYDTDLMFDAFSTWDLQYAMSWARRVEEYRPRWIEEPFPTANIDTFVEFAGKTNIPIATGEHFYGRWDVHNFLSAGAISVVQADPEWCGGVSELVKICHLASVHGAHVIPHGHSLHAAMHVVASQPVEVCPLVEFLLNKMQGSWYQFEKHRLEPVDGMLTLPDRPGFGIEFDEDVVVETRPVTWRLSDA
jgi:L-rhamnonate dehydratase